QVADEMQTGYPHVSSKLRALSKGLTRLNQMTGDSSILTPRDIMMISQALGDETLKTVHLELVRTVKFHSYRALYTNMSSVHFKMQSINNNVFFFYEGGLYGRPKNMASEVSGFFKDKNVALLSATIDDSLSHARECGVDLRRFDSSASVILTDYPAVRRKN